MPKRWVTIGIFILLIVTCFGSVGLYLFARDPYSEQQIRELTDKAYNAQRPGGGRLSGAAYSPIGRSLPVPAELGTAQIILLRQPDSEVRQRLQGLVYLAAGDWQNFIEITSRSPGTANFATLNNLGASYLALSDKNPSLLLNAMDSFDRASQLDPKAPEPLFNLVITYRKLRFQRLADETLQRYTGGDPNSPWNHELKNPVQIDEALVLDQLEKAAESNNLVESVRLFEANPELCRRIVMAYALRNEVYSPALLNLIAAQMDRRYGDMTLTAMLAPLFTDQRDTTIALRDFVDQGAHLYEAGNFPESLAAYSEARKLDAKLDSLFDHLWIDLNEADTQIKLGHFDGAREILSHMIPISRKNGFVWLTARALSLYGSSMKLTDSYGEMLGLLTEADRTFILIDAPHDRIRVLYYLAAYRYGAGDQDEGLKLALECLRLINTTETSRISTLDWLIGSILYRHEMPREAVLFAKESVDQSQITSSPMVQATTATSLAELYASLSQHDLADRYFQVAKKAFQNIPEGFDRTRGELLLDVEKARSDIDQKQYGDAESLLRRNLKIYYQQPFPATRMLSQSLMLSAQVYAGTGRIREAAKKFSEAIDVVENDDEYLKSEGLRVKFDDERRELYDSAIEFEFNNGSSDAAWAYLQKYRAKLFLEFLAAFNPGLEHSRVRLDRAVVQRRVPGDTQVIEYVLLKDRLLIWLVTDKIFTVRSVAIKRAELEDKVQTVLGKLRTGDEVDLLLTELGRILVEPIANLLDPSRTIAIIPDRALNGLPFAALRHGSGRYLVQDFPIVVSPSLTHFLAANTIPPSRDTVVGFGSQNGGAAELKELASLKDIYPNAETFSGVQVDKSGFLAHMSKAAVFHYAGHSATDAIDPLRSAILLDGNRAGPNSVTAVDIAQQHLVKNAVVILSSCDSSVGNSRDGIGVRGLTSAFLIGGAGSVVGSLWRVEDSSTADLMIRFHREFVNSQMPVAKALRQAQLTFLRSFPEKAHPYYWSGFVVTGNFSALH